MDSPLSPLSFTLHFSCVSDPRVDRTRRHNLHDILAVAICAVISGCDTWEEVAQYGLTKHPWLSTWLDLPGGIPSHDTFCRVFSLLNPQQFQQAFQSWILALCKELNFKHIAIDGKTLRGSSDRRCTHGLLSLVSAWSVEHHLSLAQVAVEEDTNDIAAIPNLLAMLELRDTVVTSDALGCQKEIARQIIEQQGDYVLALKGNQPTLHTQVVAAFNKQCASKPHDHTGIYVAEEKSHGRQEKRTYTLVDDLSEVPEAKMWAGMKRVCRVRRESVVAGKRQDETRYFIGSVEGTVEEYAKYVRGHWGIENSLHWILDVVFREDANRTQERTQAENLAWLRRVAVSMLKRINTKQSIKTKSKRAGWDDEFLLQVLCENKPD